MPYNPDSPKVKAAKEIAEKFGFDQVIVIGIDDSDGIISGVSYGTTKQKCNEAKSKMDAAYDAVRNSY